MTQPTIQATASEIIDINHLGRREGFAAGIICCAIAYAGSRTMRRWSKRAADRVAETIVREDLD